jgi:hypothetical protein
MMSSSPSRPPPSDEQIQLKLNSPSPVIPSSPRSLRPPNQLSLQASSSYGEDDCSDAAQSPSRLNHLPLSVISEADDSDSEADSIAPINENNSQQLSQHSTDRPNPVHGVTGVHLRASLEDGNRMMDHSAVKSGYLMKKGERRKAWKKRWFVLRGGQVAMYKNDKVRDILPSSATLFKSAELTLEGHRYNHNSGISTAPTHSTLRDSRLRSYRIEETLVHIRDRYPSTNLLCASSFGS